jgi:pre-rRNA-processing protein TSR4
MPNLINTLGQAKKGDNKKPKTDQERMKELEGVLRGGENGDEKRDMEWGTCMIFSCEKDCCDDDGRECWREEIVLVEWDE